MSVSSADDTPQAAAAADDYDAYVAALVAGWRDLTEDELARVAVLMPLDGKPMGQAS